MPFTFAELLRGFRQRASVTQDSLAADLSVHSNTLSAWERGLYLPKDREIILRLAEDLVLTHAETDQLLRAAEFPPAYGTPNPLTMRHQLRAPVADFIGRATEIQQLRTALQAAVSDGSSAIISGVRGMGGIGKTELAYRVAHDLCAAFPQGQIVVELRGASTAPLSPEQAIQGVIRALMPEVKLPQDLTTLEPLYRSALHQQRVLILADDARDAAQVRPLSPPLGCALLVTSRMRFTLPGMIAVDLEQFGVDEAVAVLRRICPRLSAAEAQMLAHACDYLPLALRVSGSILQNDPALLVAGYLARLADERQRLAQLRDPDDPHLDVEASLALSYVRLDATAQRVFRQLGVLAADFTIDLAQAVIALDEEREVADVLRSLLRRNLVQYDGRARWRLHDLLRDLARRELERAGEWEVVMRRYARAAVQISQVIQDQYLAGGAEILAALARFDSERPHIDAARQWATSHAGTATGDALLVADAIATNSFGNLRYDLRRELLPQLETALSAARHVGDQRAEGTILNRLGVSYLALGNLSQAILAFEDYRTIAQASGDLDSEGRALNNLGLTYAYLGDPRRARDAYQQCLVISQVIGHRQAEGVCLGNLGIAFLDLGEAQQAQTLFEQALVIRRELGDRQHEGIMLLNLGLAALNLGEAHRARAFFKQALTLFRTLGDRHHEGFALHGLGRTVVAMGKARRAITWCESALVLLREVGDQRAEGYALCTVAQSYAALRDVTRARATFEVALTLLHAAGDRHGEAESRWVFGLALIGWGERERALPLLRAAVAYEQEIGHAKAATHAALLAHLEAGEDLPADVLPVDRKRAVGNDVDTADSAKGTADAPTK